MNIALVDYWPEDPLPTPPTGDQQSMGYWRWLSAFTLNPHPAHTDRDCDESCAGCPICYVQTGETVCDRLCEHGRVNDPEVGEGDVLPQL